jgi:serine phosphatase RsbU (regulator of sigma subunit)
MRKTFALALFILFFVGAKSATVEELLSRIDTTTNDTLKVKLLEQLCWKHLFSEPDVAQEYAHKGIKLAETIGYRAGLASIYSDLGILNDYHNNYAASIENYDKALQIDIEDGDEKGEARIYNNLGIFYKNRGELDVAIEYFIKSLTIKEKRDDKRGISSTKLGIGNIYYNRKDYQTALLYYAQSYAIDLETGDTANLGISANNVGLAYYDLGKLDSAEFYYKIAEKASLESENYRSQSNCYNNIGLLNLERNKLDLAFQYFKRSYEIDSLIEDYSSMTSALLNMSRVYSKKGNYQQSIKIINKALAISNEIEDLYGQINGYEMLASDLYLNQEYKLAYEEKDRFIILKDSIKILENEEHLENLNAKYESEKKELMIDKLNQEKQVQELEIKRQNMQKIAFAIGFGLMLILAFVIFRSLKQKQKANQLISQQKKEVELQKEIVEEKNQEILDSIKYAKRIQNAILPPQKVVKEYLQESFILYKPKDIVAGDFYWMESPSPTLPKGKGVSPPSGESEGGCFLFAVADCTGHGVPGAMVSVICNNGLNRSVREYGLTDPGDILNKTREIVVQEFEKSDEEVKDGMDIALCSLRFNVQDSMLNKQARKLNPETSVLLEYAGANNPLWIVTNCQSDLVPNTTNSGMSILRRTEVDTPTLLEIKANKQPIGKFDNTVPYTTHTLELQRGDCIYIFTDGYVDQFGGEKGKKFKSKAFKELLLSINDKPMEEQNIIIDNAFEAWKGNLEQIDDVCVIGVRI